MTTEAADRAPASRALRRGLALVVLVSGAVVGGCARHEDRAPAARRGDFFLPRETELVEGRVPRQATLATILRGARLREDLIPAMVAMSGQLFNLRTVKEANHFRLERTFGGLLRSFEYEIDNDKYLRVVSTGDRQPDDLKAELVPYRKERAATVIRGEITRDVTSLFSAMEAAGERPDLSVKMADIFSGEIDFNTELQPDDTFTLAFDKVLREGQFSEYGDIVAAEFRNSGRVHTAVRFTVPGEKPGYYDEQGRSLRRLFLKSPLPFVVPKVTSRFSASRLHPILRILRPHLGVDYKAYAGATVVAVANGTVASAGWSGDAGRLVRLRHPSGYETLYMHLSAIGPGIRPGAHVSQGEVIGKVGTSGLSTGPHLDYRVKLGGRFVNPLKVLESLPPGDPVPDAYMAAFRAERNRALAALKAAPAPAVPPRS